MANSKTAIKQWGVSLKRRAHNRPIRAAVRSFLTQARTAIAQHAADADAQVVKAVSELDKSVSKGLMHRNAAARRKSRLMKRLNASK